MLECKNVTKKYMSSTAVHDITLNIYPGKTYAMLGPNGSGKTTLMKMICGLIQPTSGSITFDGCPIGKETKQYITYMPTENYFYSYMNIRSIANYYKDFFPDFNEDLYYSLLKQMDLDTNIKARNMSSGMLAKLKLAAAMARQSCITLLDEPLNGMDITARDKIVKTILNNRAPGNTIILSTHLIEELDELVDELIFIKNGRLINAGSAAQIKEQYNQLSLINIYRNIYGEGNDYAEIN